VVTQAVNKAVSGDFRAIVFVLTGIPWLPQELVRSLMPRKVVDPETVERVFRMMRGTLGEMAATPASQAPPSVTPVGEQIPSSADSSQGPWREGQPP